MFIWIGLGIWQMAAHRSGLKTQLRFFIKDLSWSFLLIPFILVFITGSYSDDTTYWLERCRIKLPFLTLPFFFFWLPSITRKERVLIYLLFIVIVALSTLGVLTNYLFHFSEYTKNLNQGIPIPTPIHHIRFSLLIGIACLSSFLIYAKNESPAALPRKIFLYLSIYLFFTIHVLAVRNGIVCLYGTVFVLWAYDVFVLKNRRFRLAIAIFLVPLFAYLALPSMQSRINFMVRDLGQIGTTEFINFSDAERLHSMVIGLEIFSEHPLVGTGAGDLKSEMAAIHAERYNRSSFLMPHNQWISVFAGTGLIGGLLFIAAFLVPYLYQQRFRDPYFTIAYWMLMISFFFENTIETSVGVAIVLFFFLVNLRTLTPELTTSESL